MTSGWTPHKTLDKQHWTLILFLKNTARSPFAVKDFTSAQKLGVLDNATGDLPHPLSY